MLLYFKQLDQAQQFNIYKKNVDHKKLKRTIILNLSLNYEYKIL